MHKLEKGCKNREKRLDIKFASCYNNGVVNKASAKAGEKNVHG